MTGQSPQSPISPEKLCVFFFRPTFFIIMERLHGDGYAVVHAGGCLMECTLSAGEILRIDTSNVRDMFIWPSPPQATRPISPSIE